MDFRSFMLGGVDGELNFLPVEGASEGQNSSSVKSMNNNAPMIDATPISSVYPSNVVENVADSDDPSYREDEQTLIGPSLSPHPEASKNSKFLVAGEASTPLDVDNDSNIHEFPLAKELKDATDCHWVDKAKTSYDVIRARELDKDRAYAGLERKCNEALQDLDKNPLVSDMHVEIRALQGQVDSLHGIESERERLKSSKIKLLQEIDSLKQDRADVVSKVILDAAMKLIRNDDLEVAAMEEPFVLENMSGYRPSSKEEYDQASDALANASYPFLAEYVTNPYASLEQLLSKKPPLLRPTFFVSRSKPLSSKVK
ncbi:hypothetical protein Tco_0445825 [Tanacetum coccineum]